MKPIPMLPAYRHGAMTPWGSDALKRVYGREIPEEVTGEALEVSAVPGLESRTPEGETLPELMVRYGTALTGEGYEKEFPLLLKLLAAKTPLSVQVHPDDAYARVHENGKLGKTEAWVILQAEEGAELLYGIREGVTREELAKALESGEDVEPLIARRKVQPGDVLYMPAGMVHAIGGGILLYEIQQSSDVTYRLWDYNRTNDKGEKRPLHIRQSLDVVRPELKGQTARMPEGDGNDVTRLLDVPAFRLDCLRVQGSLAVPREEGTFGILTAFGSLKLLCSDGTEMPLKNGDTLLLPAQGEDWVLSGCGKALLSRPGK